VKELRIPCSSLQSQDQQNDYLDDVFELFWKCAKSDVITHSLCALGKAFKPSQNAIKVISVNSKAKSYLAIAMGIVILLADLYWLVAGSSYTYPPWLAAGIIIFVADLVWLWLDYELMK